MRTWHKKFITAIEDGRNYTYRNGVARVISDRNSVVAYHHDQIVYRDGVGFYIPMWFPISRTTRELTNSLLLYVSFDNLVVPKPTIQNYTSYNGDIFPHWTFPEHGEIVTHRFYVPRKTERGVINYSYRQYSDELESIIKANIISDYEFYVDFVIRDFPKNIGCVDLLVV